MSGIYIHIPFCHQKCHYCDFFKTTDTSKTDTFLSALLKEAKIRQNYLEKEIVETIYIGGGTPSVLYDKQLFKIIEFIKSNFEISNEAEITFEANPDDLNENYLNQLHGLGINRLSVGIQSFENDLLQKMNRRHNADQALECIENSIKAGFNNLSIDLIYGLPGLTQKQWEKSLHTAFSLPIQHVSAYHLTYHKGTTFHKWLNSGTIKELNEKESVNQFSALLRIAENNGFEMYEISNFARNEQYSKHNTSYWTGKKYLGLGPSAHSFNGSSRQWNISDLNGYINAIKKDIKFFEKEELSEKEKYNEYVLTRIRTKWGINLQRLEIIFGAEIKRHFNECMAKYIKSKKAFIENDICRLSKEGLFISDEIMADLMII